MKRRYFFSIICLMMASAALANVRGTPPGIDADAALVNGIVIDKDSRKPLKDVNVTAVMQSEKGKTVSTDSNGNFHFIMLKPGTYRLVFEKEGYKKVVKDKVEVKEKRPVKISVEMFEFVPISDRGPSAWHFFES